MKNLLLVLVAFASVSSWATVDQEYTLHCQTKITAKKRLELGVPQNNGNITDLTAQFFDIQSLREVRVVVNGISDFDGKSYAQEGRRDFLEADQYKKDSKYSKNFYRFELSKLIDTETFGNFYVDDMCEVLVYLPKDGAKRGSFKAQVSMHCDQNGGRGTAMECTATPVKN